MKRILLPCSQIRVVLFTVKSHVCNYKQNTHADKPRVFCQDGRAYVAVSPSDCVECLAEIQFQMPQGKSKLFLLVIS